MVVFAALNWQGNGIGKSGASFQVQQIQVSAAKANVAANNALIAVYRIGLEAGAGAIHG